MPHLCTRLRTDGIKPMLRGFSGGKQVINFSNTRNRGQSSLFILDNRKWITFYIKDDNGNLWVEVIIFTFLDAVAALDVLTTSSNDVNFVETQTVHFAWPFNHLFVLRE